jgi:hypothetical protein
LRQGLELRRQQDELDAQERLEGIPEEEEDDEEDEEEENDAQPLEVVNERFNGRPGPVPREELAANPLPLWQPEADDAFPDMRVEAVDDFADTLDAYPDLALEAADEVRRLQPPPTPAAAEISGAIEDASTPARGPRAITDTPANAAFQTPAGRDEERTPQSAERINQSLEEVFDALPNPFDLPELPELPDIPEAAAAGAAEPPPAAAEPPPAAAEPPPAAAEPPPAAAEPPAAPPAKTRLKFVTYDTITGKPRIASSSLEQLRKYASANNMPFTPDTSAADLRAQLYAKAGF